MSPKELLYIEDSLGHEQHMQDKCKDYAEKIKDPELKEFVSKLQKKHQELFGEFYKLL